MSNRMKSLCTALVSLLLIVYVGYHVYKGTGKTYPTEIAMQTTYSDAVQVPCWFIRGEQVLTADQSGYLRYAAADGEKVAEGGTVAQVYAAERSITAYRELQTVQTQLDHLKALNAQALGGVHPSAMTEKISNQLVAMLQNRNRGETASWTDDREKLGLYFSQKQIVTGEWTDFSAQIAALEAQAESLKAETASPVGEITAPISGYFSAEPDGWEQKLTPDRLAQYTADELRTMQPDAVPQNAIGKLAPSNVWYAACILSASDARRFEAGTRVRVSLPNTNDRIPVTVQRVNANGIEGDAVVILRGDTMSGALVSVRSGTVQLELQRYSGLQVNRSAIHKQTCTKTVWNKDGTSATEQVEVQGVYVIYGEQIRFREVAPIFWGDSVVICDSTAEPSSGTPMLKQYDQVITEGKDLYDGKPIN